MEAKQRGGRAGAGSGRARPPPSGGCPCSLPPAPLKPTSLFSLFKEEPRKVCFTYDLFLNLEGNPPVNHLRCEKLTFNNPTIEFRYKLLMAGGVSVPQAGALPGADGPGCSTCSIVTSWRWQLLSLCWEPWCWGCLGILWARLCSL